MSIVNAVTCPVCGCLCDDIELTIEDGKVTQIKNGCAMCESKFLNYMTEHRTKTPLIRKDGKLVPVSYEEAIHKSAEILANASYPILYGWSSTDCEAQRVGVELAEEVGGVLDNTAVVCHGPSILGVQEVGIPTATLGQIRHRADLIIYWGCDPWSAHPRHLERYTSFTDGRFEASEWKSYLNKVKASVGMKKRSSVARRRGLYCESAETVSDNKPPETLNMPTHTVCVNNNPATMNKECVRTCTQGRKLIVVDVRKTMTANAADYFIQVKPGKDYEIMQAIRALVKEEELDVDEVGGVSVEYLEELVDVMINCQFGVIFFGMGLTQSAGKFRNVEDAISLIRDLNMRTKFVIIPMRGHFNVTGANTVFTWQSGYPYAIDFSLGYPKYNPGETTVVDILLRKESDAALVIASDPVSNFPRKAAEHLVKTPLIVIDPHMNVTAMVGDVVFPSSIVGIEKAGTAYRMDHVPLPLKKVVEPPEGFLSDEEILQRILEEVRRIKSQEKKGAN
jgi:formylmethanofuran dehydrogenase subunit B